MKTIALIAHDNMKPMIVKWARDNKEILKNHKLVGTGHTAKMVADATGLEVKAYRSGPLGGDLEIGSRTAEGLIDAIIFFSDPLTAQPHDPDVKALLRIAIVYDIPIANNKSTADCIINSKEFSE